MAKLTDPDSLNQATEVIFDTAAKTIQLLVAGNLFDTTTGKLSGVTGQALYSFTKEEWRTDTALNKYRFPIQMIFEAKFILINGWTWKDQQSEDLIRDAGFKVNATGDERACIISLGAQTADTDPSYYAQVEDFTTATSSFDKTGELNENVSITGANTYFKAFNRVQGKNYSSYALLSEQGISALSYQAYSFPLSNTADNKITNTDDVAVAAMTNIKINYLLGTGFTTFAGGTVYPAESVVVDDTGRWFFTVAGGTSTAAITATSADVSITDWAPYEGERLIGVTYRAFNRILESDGAYLTQPIYEWSQYQLRRTGVDINAADVTTVNQRAGTVNGEKATDLLYFVGDQLHTRDGLFVDGYAPAEKNSYTFWDIRADGGGLDTEGNPVLSDSREFPFVATGTLNFGDNVVQAEINNAGTTKYSLYYDYITSTTDSTIAFTVSASPAGDITWTGTVLDHIITGDYLVTSGFTDTTLNGEWLVGTTGANTMAVTRQGAGITVSSEVAGNAITVLEDPFESAGATLVKKDNDSDITGAVTAASIAWDYDYDNDTEGGRAIGDVPCTLVTIADDGAQYLTVSHTISRTAGQSISANPVDELNYKNI